MQRIVFAQCCMLRTEMLIAMLKRLADMSKPKGCLTTSLPSNEC